jgi:hypothetical protein
VVRRPILLSFLLSCSHLFCTPDFFSGKNTITLKNGNRRLMTPVVKKVKLEKRKKMMASSVASKNRESKSKKRRIVNRKPLGSCT